MKQPTQRGLALITALILLVLVTLIGLAASRTVRQQVVMTNNTRERELAFQAAEAALRDAQDRLPSFHAALQANIPSAGLIDRHNDLNNALKVAATTAAYWVRAASQTEPYGYGWFDSEGRVDASKSIESSLAISGLDKAPRYVVEYLGVVAETACSTTEHRYRVTALAGGASSAERKQADTRVILQSELTYCPPD